MLSIRVYCERKRTLVEFLVGIVLGKAQYLEECENVCDNIA
jgi:hypothetical protein